MSPNYFIAMLPDLTSDFYKAIESLHSMNCYPEIRLPFHTTLYFFGEITDSTKSEIEKWMDKEMHNYQRFSAEIKSVNFFSKNDLPTCYYLELVSPKLHFINNKLKVFSYIHRDNFPFLPHISLFFPKAQVSEKDHEYVAYIFKDFKEILFKGIYLGSVVENTTRIHKLIKFQN